jgi:hypothetical protein
MDQGSNFKKQVMEALFNAPTNLINNKAIMWAATNLPDEGGNGSFSSKASSDFRTGYQHDHSNFWTALGFSEETVDKVSEDVKRIFIKASLDSEKKSLSKSEIFERVEKEVGESGMLFLAVLGFMKVYEQMKEADDDIPEPLKNLLRSLDDLHKKLGGSDDTKS